MPSCAIHLELAGRVLDAWRVRPSARPFAPDDPACRRAFLFGSLGPDLGYFPGGDGLLADLAHCVRSSQLARNLIATAEADRDRALAWGWVTHILADVWIHPLINQAAGERISGQRLPGLTFVDDPITHVRIELGLDALLPARGRWADRVARGGIGVGPEAVAALTRAYRQTYGFTLSRLRTRVANRLSPAFVSAVLLGGSVFSGRPAGLLARSTYRWTAGFARRFGRGGRLEAFTNPLTPPDWLLTESESIIDVFTERFLTYYDSNLAELPDYNLDTGEVEGEPPHYPLTIAALAKLARRPLARTSL
jgi:hypothetical protein